MSKELEMLRGWIELTNAPETIDLFGNKVRQASLDAADLRAILARLEAAERVCEKAISFRWSDAPTKDIDDMTDAERKEATKLYDGLDDALRAYRDLDAKQEKG